MIGGNSMQCNECHKRPATLHLTKYENGKTLEVQVCEVCAKKLGYMNQQDDTYSLHDLLSGFFNMTSPQVDMQNNHLFEQMEETECPKCHLSFREFQKIGKFGCAECYETFRGKIDRLFRRVHSGNIKHYGKIPKRQGNDLHQRKQLAQYREELKLLIDEEAFEKAAVVRDKIKELERREEGDDT